MRSWGMDDVAVERVLRTVEAIPTGRVAAYGQIGAIAGVGARQVGAIMRDWSRGTAWWRVVNASGELPGPLMARALPHWREEGIGLRADGRGCRIADHQADLATLRMAAQRAFADLPAAPGRKIVQL